MPRRLPYPPSFASCLFLVALLSGSPVFSQSKAAESPGARELARTALARPDSASAVAALEAGLRSVTAPADRVFILKTIASLEERTGNPASALERYKSAATAGPSRDDSLLLDAARCALALNDPVAADALVRSVLQTSFDGPANLRARIYSAWVQLGAGKRDDALSLIRSFAANPACAEYAPALLFTLWWSDGDAAARASLIASWPRSFEAACARGEATVGPSSFWYLMNRNEGGVASFARAGSAGLAETLKATSSGSPDLPPAPIKPTAPVSTAGASATANAPASAGAPVSSDAPASIVKTTPGSGSGHWQQIGFFRNREYADELVEKLKKHGFEPVIREVVRPSGTRYHTVLVPENEDRTTGQKLKNEGFESYPVTE